MLSRPDVPRPSAAACDKARSLLERALGPSKVLTDHDACERFVCDEVGSRGCGARLRSVLAENAEDILAALAVAREAEVPITPRSGGTGRTGGSVPVAGGIEAVDLGHEVRSLRSIAARASPWCSGRDLAGFARSGEAEGWFYPPDPNSQASCALGGNVAENAGGPRAFKYGVTRDYVLGMDAFLIGGQRMRVGRRTIKGVTGYDVTGLLVGSEGTLAVFGDITLQLIPKPERVMTLMDVVLEREAGQRGGAGGSSRAAWFHAASSSWTRPRWRRCAARAT